MTTVIAMRISQQTACLTAAALTITVAFVSWMTRSDYDVRIAAPRAKVVSIRAFANGAFLQVGRDSLVRASGGSGPVPAAGRFRMFTVSGETVRSLRGIATVRESQLSALRQRRTRSGCECSGFSSEFGFGRYCHAWEHEYEEAWCYVGDGCFGGRSKRGSFGRKNEICAQGPPPSPPPTPPSPPPPPYPPAAPSPPKYESEFARHVREERGRWVRRYNWLPPTGCLCSGFANSHGFGAYCAAWESSLEPDQTPWCYVSDSCASGEAGSFNHKHADCARGEKKGLFSVFTGRRRLDEREPAATGPARTSADVDRAAQYSRSRRVRKFARLEAARRDSEALERRASQYVMFLSEETGGFLSADLPPVCANHNTRCP